MTKLQKVLLTMITALSVVSVTAYACQGSICGAGDGWIAICDLNTGALCHLILR